MRKVIRKTYRTNLENGEGVLKLVRDARRKKIKKDKSLGPKCVICGDRGSLVEREKVTRRCFGIEYPVRVCSSCNRFNSDWEILTFLLPRKKWHAARIYASPDWEGNIDLPVCVNDIRIGHSFHRLLEKNYDMWKNTHDKSMKNLKEMSAKMELRALQNVEGRIVKRKD